MGKRESNGKQNIKAIKAQGNKGTRDQGNRFPYFLVNFLTCFLITLLTYGYAEGKIVQRIRITGNQTVSIEKIKKVLTLKEGEPFSEEDLDKDIKAIYQLGYFVDVVADMIDVRGGVEVIFSVIEKPMVKRIDFKGNQDFSANKLLKKIKLKIDEPVDKMKMQEAADQLIEFYKNEGYAEAKVEVYSTMDKKSPGATITFYIEEGTKIKIEKIIFKGVKTVKTKKLLKLMKTKHRHIFKEKDLENDLEEITSFYKERGYCDVSIGEPEFFYTEQAKKKHREVRITIPVEEGEQFFVGDILFTGEVTVGEEKLKSKLELASGEIFAQSKFDRSLASLQACYAEEGYAQAVITPELKREENRINIEFKIAENEKVYINQVYIEGNTRTKEPVIRRELEIKPGDPFCLSKIQTSQAKIYRLGYFQDVKLATTAGPQPNTLDLVFTVKEQQTGMLSAGAGVNSVDGLVGNLELSEINLFGRGLRVNATWEFGKRRINYRLGFSTGWMFGYHLPFGLDVYDTKRRIKYRAPGIDAWYWRENKGGDFRLGKYFTTYTSAHLGYTYETVRSNDFTGDVELVDGIWQTSDGKIKEKEEIVSSLTPTFMHDNRDIIFNAKKGGLQKVSFEVAGGILGGNSNFVKTIGEVSQFIPLFWKFTLGLHTRLGDLERYGVSEDVPIYERFFVGGVEGVRGYNYYGGEIGPPEGGRLMLVFNMELKFPLVSEEGHEILQGVIFYDAGNSWNATSEMGQGIFLKQGVGVGLRFITPSFPLRLDWGYGLNHRPGEDKSQPYFTIGSMF